MKQIKAFVNRKRVADLVHALEAGGFGRLSLFDVKGLLHALDKRDQEYSVALGEQIVSEVQMELFCEDDRVEAAVAIFRSVGRTGRADAGAVYVSPIDQAHVISGDPAPRPA